MDAALALRSTSGVPAEVPGPVPGRLRLARDGLVHSGDRTRESPSSPRNCPEGAASEPTNAGVDALEALGEEIATLAAHLHAATHRLLTLIAEFDRRRGWEPGGFRSCAHWLAFRTGIDLGAAREKVRAARALEDLPGIGTAMERGELSFAKVRALTRVATKENESELLAFARDVTAAELERTVRGYRRTSRLGEAELERERHRSRFFSVFPEDGMYVVRGRLDPEAGALLMRAIEAAGDALYRAGALEVEETEPAQRRADALGLVAERALAAGFGRSDDDEIGDGAAVEEEGESTGALAHSEISAATRVDGRGSSRPRSARGSERGAGTASSTPDRLSQPEIAAETRTDGRGSRPDSGPESERHPGITSSTPDRVTQPGISAETPVGGLPAPVSGSRAERYQVVIHVDPPTLEDGAEPQRSELEDGTRLSAETSRRLACDASVVRLTRAPDGSVLDVGRRTRTIPPALRRALEARDRGCRFPGCGSRFTDAHHIVHWADGGETKLSNLILLCRLFRYRNKLHYSDSRIIPTPGR